MYSQKDKSKRNSFTAERIELSIAYPKVIYFSIFNPPSPSYLPSLQETKIYVDGLVAFNWKKDLLKAKGFPKSTLLSCNLFSVILSFHNKPVNFFSIHSFHNIFYRLFFCSVWTSKCKVQSQNEATLFFPFTSNKFPPHLTMRFQHLITVFHFHVHMRKWINIHISHLYFPFYIILLLSSKYGGGQKYGLR